MIHPRPIIRTATNCGLGETKTQHTKYILIPVVLILAAVAGAVAVSPASAQNTSGQFNPQTQFAVGTKLQITSIYGLETVPPPSLTLRGAGFNNGNSPWKNGSQNWGNNQTSRSSFMNQQWNLTYLRNLPTANSSITLNVQITNDTQDGAIIWTVQSGSIAYNGTTLTVTNGVGGIGKLDRVLTVGNATDSNGNSYRWSLEGLTTLYGGTVILSLNGIVSEMNQNSAATTSTFPYRGFGRQPGVTLTYLATIS